MNNKPVLFATILTLAVLSIYWINIPSSSHILPPQPIYTHANLHNDNTSLQLDSSETLIDVTLQSGIQQPHIQRGETLSGLHESMGAGACAFDYNRDGWTDLLILNGSGTHHFLWQTQMVAAQ